MADVIDGVSLSELEAEIRELAATCVRLGPAVESADVARLGVVLADLTKVLPRIPSAEAREYFTTVESLARGALSAVMLRKRHDC